MRLRPVLILLVSTLATHSAWAGFTVLRSPPPEPPPALAPAPLKTTGDAPLYGDDGYGDRDLDDLRQKQEQIRKTTADLSDIQSAPPIEPSVPSKLLAGMTPEAMAQVQAMMNSPFFQGIKNLSRDPQFMAGITELLPSKDHKKHGITQLSFMFFMFVFRSWRSKQHDHWLGKLWVHLYSFVILAATSAVFIPVWIYGDPYQKVMKALSRAFL